MTIPVTDIHYTRKRFDTVLLIIFSANYLEGG